MTHLLTPQYVLALSAAASLSHQVTVSAAESDNHARNPRNDKRSK
jgi:hypothetical protein